MSGAHSGRRLTLFLAGRAPEPEPFLARRTLLAPPDRCPAPAARPARSAIHPVLPAGPGVPCRHVSEPHLVGVEQPVPKIDQGFQVPDLTDGTPGIDAPQEQHLCSKICARTGQVALVEQGLADRAAGFGGQPPYRLGAVPVRAEQIRSQVPGDLRLFAGPDQFDDAELIADRLPVVV